jgi:hypothetical protein
MEKEVARRRLVVPICFQYFALSVAPVVLHAPKKACQRGGWANVQGVPWNNAIRLAGRVRLGYKIASSKPPYWKR